MVTINRKAIKTAAKEQIQGNIWTFLGLTIVLGLIYCVASVSVIGAFVLYGALEVGLCMFILDMVRTKHGSFGTGFNGFNRFVPALVATLIQVVFIFLWSLLLVIPGIIAAFRYSMTYFIIADDPEISGYAAMQKSAQMMKGHKGDLFVLYLSFFWWILLCCITCGIASIYVLPYMSAALGNFYETLKDETK